MFRPKWRKFNADQIPDGKSETQGAIELRETLNVAEGLCKLHTEKSPYFTYFYVV